MSFAEAVKTRLRRWRPQQPHIVEASGQLRLSASSRTFVVVCGAQFDQTVPSAGTTYRMGLSHGFEELGIPYRLVNAMDLERDLAELPNPICFISGFDYQYLSRSALKLLKRQKHFVWIGPWFDGEKEFYRDHNLEDLTTPAWLRKRILASEPPFVFTPVTQSGLSYYEQWTTHGATLISLPLACDTTVYVDADIREESKFDGVELAFVGGYWPYKARQFDKYLKPYENRLTVFGYSRWPYAGYGGPISAEDEPALLRQARLCPAVNEPHAEILGGEICERVYKVLGSGGMCVTDATAAHRDVFAADELLVPRDLNHYNALVADVLNDDALCLAYRDKGRKAVMNRHTYAHRARRILEEFNIGSGAPDLNGSANFERASGLRATIP